MDISHLWQYLGMRKNSGQQIEPNFSWETCIKNTTWESQAPVPALKGAQR
jgi:hypothetical protein